MNLHQPSPSETSPARPLEQKTAAKDRPRVLVADDDMQIRHAIELLLRAEFDVTLAGSGEKAIELIRSGMKFEVASLDLRMPGRSGVETLKELKSLDPSLEVLIVTAHSDVDSAKKALRYGAYDLIDKPFKNETYRAAIRRGVERRTKSRASRKALEQLEFVQAQLKQSEKFAVIGQLIAGVVHELNNALNSVIGFSELLTMENFPPEETREYLNNINEAAGLCRSIVQKLLRFSRNESLAKEPVDINEVLQSALDLKRHDFKVDRIEVVKDLAGAMPYTNGIYNELQQVFLNLMANAQYAMKSVTGERRLTVRSEFDPAAVRVSVEDTGTGIPKENLQKIFEPLFTTKEKGVGTGLGLSVCYDIIRDHGGSILVASEPGRGACFVIELPVLKTPPAQGGSFEMPTGDAPSQ